MTPARHATTGDSFLAIRSAGANKQMHFAMIKQTLHFSRKQNMTSTLIAYKRVCYGLATFTEPGTLYVTVLFILPTVKGASKTNIYF